MANKLHALALEDVYEVVQAIDRRRMEDKARNEPQIRDDSDGIEAVDDSFREQDGSTRIPRFTRPSAADVEVFDDERHVEVELHADAIDEEELDVLQIEEVLDNGGWTLHKYEQTEDEWVFEVYKDVEELR